MSEPVTVGWLLGVAIGAVCASAGVSFALYKLLKNHLDAQIEASRRETNARIDGFQKETNARIDGLQKETNARIDGLKTEIGSLEKSVTAGFAHSDKRFDDLNRRIDDLKDYASARVSDIRDEARKASQTSPATLQAAQAARREPSSLADSPDSLVAQPDATTESDS